MKMNCSTTNLRNFGSFNTLFLINGFLKKREHEESEAATRGVL